MRLTTGMTSNKLNGCEEFGKFLLEREIYRSKIEQP